MKTLFKETPYILLAVCAVALFLFVIVPITAIVGIFDPKAWSDLDSSIKLKP